MTEPVGDGEIHDEVETAQSRVVVEDAVTTHSIERPDRTLGHVHGMVAARKRRMGRRGDGNVNSNPIAKKHVPIEMKISERERAQPAQPDFAYGRIEPSK